MGWVFVVSRFAKLGCSGVQESVNVIVMVMNTVMQELGWNDYRVVVCDRWRGNERGQR